WGLGFFTFLLSLPGILLLVGGILVCVSVGSVGLALVALGVLYLLGCSAVSAALNTIFLGALYQYAANHTVPAAFDAGIMERASPSHFGGKPRTGRRSGGEVVSAGVLPPAVSPGRGVRLRLRARQGQQVVLGAVQGQPAPHVVVHLRHGAGQGRQVGGQGGDG